MISYLEAASVLVKAVAVLALLSVVIGMVERRVPSGLKRSVTVTGAFAVAAIVAMASPALLAPEVSIDGRRAIVGLSAALGGAASAVIVPLVAGGFRYFTIGGDWALPAAVDILLAGVMGFLWSRYWIKGRYLGTLELAAGGLIISLPIVVELANLPPDARGLLLSVAPMVVLSNVCGAIVLGGLLQRERRLIDRERKLSIDVNQDALTGAANRRGLFRRIKALARATRKDVCAVALFDIDHFKTINDTWGHETGDMVLRGFTKVLEQNARSSDLVVRMGGEEFLILMPGLDRIRATAKTRRILSELRKTAFASGTREVRISASSGVTCFRPGEEDFEEVYASADQLLYRAKASGRDRVVTVVAEKLSA